MRPPRPSAGALCPSVSVLPRLAGELTASLFPLRAEEAGGERGAEEPAAEGGLPDQDPGVPEGVLHADGLPGGHHHGEPVPADLHVRRAQDRLPHLQGRTRLHTAVRTGRRLFLRRAAGLPELGTAALTPAGGVRPQAPHGPPPLALAPSLGGSRAGPPPSGVPAGGLSNGVKVRIRPGRCPRRCQARSRTTADRPREQSCQACAAPAAEGRQAGGPRGELAGAERMGLELSHLLAGTLSRSRASLLAGPREH